jgi:hypothetical protein
LQDIRASGWRRRSERIAVDVRGFPLAFRHSWRLVPEPTPTARSARPSRAARATLERRSHPGSARIAAKGGVSGADLRAAAFTGEALPAQRVSLDGLRGELDPKSAVRSAIRRQATRVGAIGRLQRLDRTPGAQLLAAERDVDAAQCRSAASGSRTSARKRSSACATPVRTALPKAALERPGVFGDLLADRPEDRVGYRGEFPLHGAAAPPRGSVLVI